MKIGYTIDDLSAGYDISGFATTEKEHIWIS